MAKPSSNQTPAELATSLGLREVDTDRVIQQIADDILLVMHRSTNSPSLKKRIEKTFSDWNPGGKWEDDNEQLTSIMLVGPPGHGKTTAFKEASKKVAAALGLEFLENAALDAVANIDADKHFVFVSQETAGVVSALEWLGLPTKQKLDDSAQTEVMGRLYSARLRKASLAAGSCILLDDFLNASPSIQNVGLSLTEERRFNDLNLTNSYIGVTGNLGAHDGTHTSNASSALRNRVRVLFIQDKLPNFIARMQERYRDPIGDAAVLSFLGLRDECFTEMPDPTKKGGYATPRSWDKFSVVARRAVRKAGSLKHAMPELVLNAAALLGLSVAGKYESYMNAYLKSADPIANDIIMQGKYDKKLMEARSKEALSGDGQAFYYQLGMALSDYAAKKVIEDKGEYKLAMTRFIEGLMLLDQTAMNMATDNFKRVLAVKVETLSLAADEHRRELKPNIKQDFCNLLVENPECTDEIRDNLIRVMSNSAQFESPQVRRQRRVGTGR